MAIIDNIPKQIQVVDVVTRSTACKNTVISGENGLQLTELQLGTDITVTD